MRFDPVSYRLVEAYMSKWWQSHAFLDRVALVATVLSTATIVVTAGFIIRLLGQVNPSEPVAAANSFAPSGEITALETRARSIASGQLAPKAVMIEFSDFQCPFCRLYATETYFQIKREFVDRGVLSYEFRHFPIESHPLAAKAAQALECAGDQGRYWEMHDRLFANQQRLTEVALAEHAETLGLDKRVFKSCLEGSKEPLVNADRDEGSRLGVRATPTFLFGIRYPDGRISVVRKIEGAQPYSVFKAAIKRTLKDSGI
jgi:protein-disulfide isomerase